MPWHNFCLIAALLSAAAVDHALGQEAPEEESDEAVLEVLRVTGSRITRPDYTSLSPTVTIDAETIRLGGYTQLEDLVNDLPQLAPAFDRTANNPGNGAVELDLRGLGAKRTLIMLNGRRAAPHSVFGAADINTIPAGLVERVEVVTGGASAVYGSDAVAGVVNFVLDTDFDGVEARVQYDRFEEGDGALRDLNLLFGLGDGPGHLTGFINLQDREQVLAGDRPFTSVILQEGADGRLVESGSPGTPAGVLFFGPFVLPDGTLTTNTGGFNASVTFDENGDPRQYVEPADLYNFQPSNYLQTPLERQVFGLFGDYEFSAARGFFELLYSRSETTSQLAPPVSFNFFSMNVDHPLLTPEQQTLLMDNFVPDDSGIVDFFLGRRLPETGPRRITRDSDSLRAVVGIEGRFDFDWDWSVAYSYSETDSDELFENGVLGSRVAQALLADPGTGECFDPSNGCVPISLFGPGAIPLEAVAFLDAGTRRNRGTVEENIVTATLSGRPFELPAGAVSTVFGFEYRDLASRVVPDPTLRGEGVLGFGSASAVDGGFDVSEVFFEAYLPLFESHSGHQALGLETGYRHADYSLSGSVGNWKLGLDWRITDAIRVRIMNQRATRAPNIDELFREPFESFAPLQFVNDYCSASADPVASGLSEVCIAQGLPADQVGVFEATPGVPVRFIEEGGNTALEPEEAETLTAGIVIQTQSGWSLSADYFDIVIEDAIGAIGNSALFELCAREASESSPFCSGVRRGPTGDIDQVINPQLNLAKARAEGVDLSAARRFDLPESVALFDGYANLDFRVFYTHTMKSGQKNSDLAPFVDCAGFFSGLCAPAFTPNFVVPDHRATTRLTYHSGPLSVNLNWQWIGKLDSHLPITRELQPEAAFSSELEQVSAQNYFDLAFRYFLGEKVEIHAGISNLLENKPPLMGFGATQSNTAPQLYDVFGRRYFLGVTFRSY